jgi:hypothetical protein
LALRFGTLALCIVPLLAGAPAPALAWVYPEHRDIAVLAIEGLDPERRAQFDRLWSEARAGNEGRLCTAGADAGQGVAPACIDWAAMSAISGDHSCSSADMLDTVLQSDWILAVADVAAQFKLDLSRIEEGPVAKPGGQGITPIRDIRRQLESEALRAERVNIVRVADIRLQRADPEYATRAGSNNAHFLLARPVADFSPYDYLNSTLTRGSEINAAGVFGWFHLSALQKATRLAQESLSTDERSTLIRSMLADEAFALHFMQDIYAAGHIAGTWGDVSQRKGTHDYYNQYGLEVHVWKPGTPSTVLMGDAHMRPADAARAGEAVRLSIEQLLDTAAGRPRTHNLPYEPQAPSQPDAFDICAHDSIEPRPEAAKVHPEALQLGVEVLRLTPIPSLEEGLGAMPRFRAEVGPFIGVAGTLDARYLDDGFTGLEGSGYVAGADLSLRIGMGLEGVLGDAGDGLIFLSAGYRGDAQSTNDFVDTAGAAQGGSLTAAIPGRTALNARLRMPFYLIPGDLLLLSPLYFISPTTYQNMAVTAGNGGLIPWQLGWATRFGRFQLVLGREIGVTFYGELSDDAVFAGGETPGSLRIIGFKSTYVDLPILEYRPYRAFDQTQSSAAIFQLYAGIDEPRSERVIAPEGASVIRFDRVYSLGVRIIFDWRRYF